jgi:hypothetical protein
LRHVGVGGTDYSLSISGLGNGEEISVWVILPPASREASHEALAGDEPNCRAN